MDVWVFDTHHNLVVRERIMINLRAMGYSAIPSNGRGTARYLLYYPQGNYVSFNSVPHSSMHPDAEVTLYDCAWMEADEVVEEIRTDAAEWVTWDSAVTTTPVDLSNYAQYFTVTNR